MASYRIQWKASAQKELKKIPQKDRKTIINKVEKLSINPLMPGTRKLVGSEISYRIRIGNYRAIYEIHDDVLIIEIIRIRHRKDAYR